MLGRVDPQGSLLGTSSMCAHLVTKGSFYDKLARHGHEIVTDDDFAELYALRRGRASIPPSGVLGLTNQWIMVLGNQRQRGNTLCSRNVSERAEGRVRERRSAAFFGASGGAPLLPTDFSGTRAARVFI